MRHACRKAAEQTACVSRSERATVEQKQHKRLLAWYADFAQARYLSWFVKG
jgi:hypothetical protein